MPRVLEKVKQLAYDPAIHKYILKELKTCTHKNLYLNVNNSQKV